MPRVLNFFHIQRRMKLKMPFWENFYSRTVTGNLPVRTSLFKNKWYQMFQLVMDLNAMYEKMFDCYYRNKNSNWFWPTTSDIKLCLGFFHTKLRTSETDINWEALIQTLFVVEMTNINYEKLLNKITHVTNFNSL